MIYCSDNEELDSSKDIVDLVVTLKELDSYKIATLADASIAGMVKDTLEMAKKKMKAITEAVDNSLIEWAKKNNIKGCDIGGDKRLIFTQPKKNRFDTQQIYKALEVSQELQDILPKNPAFSVTAVRLNEKIAHLTWEEVDEKVELKPAITDKRFLK